MERGIEADRRKQKAQEEKERNGDSIVTNNMVASKPISAVKGSAVVRPVIKGRKR